MFNFVRNKTFSSFTRRTTHKKSSNNFVKNKKANTQWSKIPIIQHLVDSLADLLQVRAVNFRRAV